MNSIVEKGSVNTGSCVTSAHIIGALIKMASIFLHRRLSRNYTEIADYILNRVGAVIVMWGATTPKAYASSAGANRLGIPVVIGPQGYKFGRTLEGCKEKGWIWDVRGKEKVKILIPSSLFVIAETINDLLLKAIRLCMRPNDTTSGRQRKIENYIELSLELLGSLPLDIPDYVRVLDDIPSRYRDMISPVLEKSGWMESFVPEPTILYERDNKGSN